MERLTQWIDDGEKKIAVSRLDSMKITNRMCLNKLAELEDLEEQGLLLKLPCKVGDIVYEIRKYSYCSSGICRSEKSCSECRENAPYKVHKKKFKIYDLKELGKTVFLTQEKAEEALRERKAKL